MKPAEALTERADATRRVEQLRARVRLRHSVITTAADAVAGPGERGGLPAHAWRVKSNAGCDSPATARLSTAYR
ncbi:hypothetical protein [Streptomyces aureocirculatus]|uniref:hypothetical protein n=1 Tax=Streptomyces aureocirculatus TaxID=67275 RepID=UPI0004C8DD42|nr:hypothetical protein [Streptomyces aureocirculatus]